MKMKKVTWLPVTLSALLGVACPSANAQVPTNFPVITVTTCDTNAVADGYVFLAVASDLTNVGYYVMILRNDGTPVWYSEVAEEKEIYDFKVLPNGCLHYAPYIEAHSFAGGGDVIHTVMDDSYNIIEHIPAGNGYVAESHDFQMLPNGNVLLFGYYRTQVDMSRIVPGGYPNALLAGATVQELDAERNVVFQWRPWDHTTFEDYFRDAINDPKNKQPVINGWHLNTIELDNDGNIFVATPQTGANLPSSSGWVKKINRQTGETMWHLGGTENEFTFVGVTLEEGLQAFSGHAFHRLENGNVLIYDNGNTAGTRASKVYEFSLDEVNKVATYVWSYVPAPLISGSGRGNAQRLPNGNTFIGWGNTRSRPVPVCTEVTPAGEVVFEMKFDDPALQSYRAFRFIWPPEQQIEFTHYELAAGNSYDFTNTGVGITVNSGGGGYNELTVTREPYAPVYPLFNGKAPRVLPVRVSMSESAIGTVGARIEFDAVSFGFINPANPFVNPTNLTVYHRTQTGQGLFVPQTPDYNPVTGKLRVTMTLTGQSGQLGEFIFCYPDVADVPYPPMLNEVENYRGVQTHEVIAPQLAATGVVYSVNQELPILLSWSPKGFARWFELEIATNQDFTNPVVDVSYQTEGFKVWSNAAPNTAYFYRVKTWNEGGEGDWSVGAFQTVAPMITVTAPNGGEAWQRGLTYFIQWNDNIAEEVVIDLYKGGAFVKSLNTNSSAGAYQWEVDLDLVPGNDYSIKISSATNAALFDVSDLAFNVDVPRITNITPTEGGAWVLEWAGTSANVYVEFSPALVPSAWTELAGPITGGSWTNTSPTSLTNGFYRLRLE